ncbi:MAG: RtcB family protein [Planctomycetota bacterium]
MIEGVPVWGAADPGAVKQMMTCLETPEAAAGALMGDHHLGYSMPIGGVVAYHGMVSPSGVGYDIACGNKAVRLDVKADDVKRDIGKIMDMIYREISFGVGRKNQEQVDHELFDDETWDLVDGLRIRVNKCRDLKQLARQQLGTVGSGNHYVDLFVDEQDNVWCGVHFGSRGLGHKLASHFVEKGGGADGMYADAVVFHENSHLGESYIRCMQLAGRYAYAGRDWVCQKVARLLKTKIVEEVHNHHNFAWKEKQTIDGCELDVWVVRKGATPAFPGQRGFVGGSMGDISVILEGVESQDSAAALYSTVHGAGRVMSRTQAAGKKRWDKKARGFVRKSEGQISRSMMNAWVKKAGVELRGAGTDESPHCYKRLPEVLEAHGNTVRIVHTLTPIGVVMAGEDEFDPYKD